MKKYFIVLLCIIVLTGCSSNNDTNENHIVNYRETKEKIINEQAILIDVRTKEEYDEKHIEGATLLPLDSIDAESVSKVVSDKEIPIILYCRSGNRSHQALEILEDLGYQNVYDLGAISNWEE